MRLLFISLLAFFLTACGGKPDEAQIRGDVERVLATSFGQGVFKIVEFIRRGSATDSTAPENERRRVVYFDVEFELTRDLSLGEWDEPGASTLITALGGGPRSITGVRGGGNQAGDRIVAHASAIYRSEAGEWSFVMPAGFREPGRSHADLAGPPQAVTALERLADITRSIESGGSRAAKSALDTELQRSLARITGRLARIEQGYPLAAGAERGEYAAFATALADLARAQQHRVLPVITAGSEENIELLRNGSVVVALAQADAAYAAYRATGAFENKGAFRTLRALGSLYPEYVQIAVRRDAPLRSAADLKGARIAVGPEGSAVRDTMTRVLAAHGFEPGIDYEPVDLRVGEGLAALGRGEVDAVAHVIGIPATPFRDVMLSPRSNVRLLPLEATAIAALADAAVGMVPATIAARVYPAQGEAVATVAVPALLLTTEDLSREEAQRMVRALYEKNMDLLAQGTVQGSQVSLRTARRGIRIPMHVGAEAALVELETSPDRQ